MADERPRAEDAQPYKPSAHPNMSPNILSLSEPIPSNLPRKLVWLGDRMHFRVTEFKQALRNEDFDSLVFIDDGYGESRMELTVRLSSVYREKMIWHKLTSAAASEGAANVLDAGAFRALREVLEPLCLYADSHVAFKRTLVAALNHLIFDDGRLVLAEPSVVGPFMDPSLTEPLHSSSLDAASAGAATARSSAAAPSAAASKATAKATRSERSTKQRPALTKPSSPADSRIWRTSSGATFSGQAAATKPSRQASRISYADLVKRIEK